jgi:hypothetical protein
MKPPRLMLFRSLIIRHSSVLYIVSVTRSSRSQVRKLQQSYTKFFLQDVFCHLWQSPGPGGVLHVAFSLPKVVLSLPAPAGVAFDVIGSLQQTLQSFHHALLFRIAKLAAVV